MYKRYFLIFVLAICLMPSSFAQKVEKTGGYARILGMGNNPYIQDPFFVTVNPAWGAYYDHFLFGDLGSTAVASDDGVGQFASVNFRVTEGFTLGAMLTRNDFKGFGIAGLDPFSIVSQIPGTLPLNNNLELMGTLMLGNTAVGLGIAYASTTNESSPGGTAGTTAASANQFGVNLGLISKLGSSMKLDLGVGLMMPSASFEPPSPGITQEGSNTIITAAARLFWDYSSKLSFVPTINFILASGSRDVLTGTPLAAKSVDLPSTMLLFAGFGINYKVGDFLLAGGPALVMSKVSQDSTVLGPESSTSNLIFPLWNLGVEWKMNDWLVGRLGYIASTGKETKETTAGGVTNETVKTIFTPAPGATVGVGFRLGSFSLDATVNEDVLRQGLNNLGGNGAIGATFAYLSASYALP